MMPRCMTIALLTLLAAASTAASARTVYRCVRDGTVSLATAPEPGSRCVAKQLDDQAAALPNLWGSLGVLRGTLYQREQEGSQAGEETHAGNVASFGPAGQRGFVLMGAVLLSPQTPDRSFLFS